MDIATILATLDAGRAATVAELRALAARLEALPPSRAAEALVLLTVTLDELRRWSERAGLVAT